MYDFYKDHNENYYGIWAKWANGQNSLSGTVIGVFNILMSVAVFAAAIAIMVSGALIAINARKGGEALEKAKVNFGKVVLVSVLIFAVGGLVMLVSSVGLDM